jgi:hypothetical protein
MNNNRQHDNVAEPAAPPRLLKALAGLGQPGISVPESVDEAILQEARRHLRSAAGIRLSAGSLSLWSRMQQAFQCWAPRALPAWRPLVSWGALAALLLLAILLARPWTVPKSNSGQLSREDLNRDGRVDILDAFALARQIEHGSHPDQRLDLNGDGVIDRRDVEILAARAVSLDQERRL